MESKILLKSIINSAKKVDSESGLFSIYIIKVITIIIRTRVIDRNYRWCSSLIRLDSIPFLSCFPCPCWYCWLATSNLFANFGYCFNSFCNRVGFNEFHIRIETNLHKDRMLQKKRIEKESKNQNLLPKQTSSNESIASTFYLRKCKYLTWEFVCEQGGSLNFENRW